MKIEILNGDNNFLYTITGKVSTEEIIKILKEWIKEHKNDRT